MNDDWKADLQPLFNPRSVALIGASESSPRSRAIFHNLKEFGYSGKIFPVHPKRAKVFGLKCFPTVLDIPEAVDAFVIAIPRAFVVPVLEQCLEKGFQSGVIVSAGFAEVSEEGKHIQDKVREIAKKGKIRICGPNSFGVANLREKVAMFLGADVRHLIAGKIGVIFQSGGLLNFVLLAAWDRGWGLSYAISSGNEAVLNVSDYAEYLVKDDRTEVIGILTEEIRDPQKFLSVARLAAQLEKPIIILKIGKSEKGKTAARAHTGAMVGSDAVYDAVFKQNGLIRARDLDDFIEKVELFSKRKKIKGEGVGFIVPSGAECGLIADIAEEAGLNLPELAPKTVQRLSKVQSPFLSIRNPLNAPEQYARKADVFRDCIGALIEDENLHIIGMRLPLPRLREDRNVVDRFGDLVEISKRTDKLLVLFSRASVSLPEYWRRLLREHDIPFLLEYRRGFKAVRALINHSRFIEEQTKPPPGSLEFKATSEKTMNLLASDYTTLTERQSKLILTQYGIPTTLEGLAKTEEEAIEIAHRIGYPVALKVESPEITHKTEARSVQLDIKSDSQLVAGYQAIIENARATNPGAQINGILVQEMVQRGKEMIIGMTQDPQWGPVILFGIGGIFVEIIHDISLRTAPITRHDTFEMLNEIKGFRILKGIRGEPEADIDAVVEILLRFSQLSVDLKDHLSEIDINPLIVFEKGKGAKVADCLMVRKC